MSTTTTMLEKPGPGGARRSRPWARRRSPSRPTIESLEARSLLNGSTSASAMAVVAPNETIDRAWELGTLGQPASMLGSVGTGPAGAADVTWYHFQLQSAESVSLSVQAPPGGRPFAGVLSLFDTDPMNPDNWWDNGDPYDPGGHRLMAQVQSGAKGGPATFSQSLGPGDYFVAVSGAGNTAFSPVVAGSGFPGATGSYELTAAANDLGLTGDGPTALWSDPAPGAALDASPLTIRVGLSEPVDPNTIIPGLTVQVFSIGAGGVEDSVPLANVRVSTPGDELQIVPMSPLAAGQYVVQLSGDASQGQPTIADLDGITLGQDERHPVGVDEYVPFSVAGVDGVAGATASDAAPATAQQLGDITGAGLVQVAGAIGVDPNLPDNPANQVDLYHFRISGPGRHALLAEVFAGRIGSPLDAGLSLYRLDPGSGQLVFVAGNDNTMDPTQGTDGTIPFFLDPALTAGLTAGDYYIAVAGGSNTPTPLEGQAPGGPGIYDPNQPGSAQNGFSTGPYLLNLMVQPAPAPLRVVASSPSPGQALGQSPTQITVRFSESVALQQLAYQANAVTYLDAAPEVFIEGSDGTKYEPRLVKYDPATNTATFQMLDGLPVGSYALHLSGAAGLTDLAGGPLAGNDPGGDYVIPFSVRGAANPLAGSPSDGFWSIAQVGQGVPQDLGLLYPDQLQTGVAILRYPLPSTAPAADATQDLYVIRVLQNQLYSFQVVGDDIPAGTQITVTSATGSGQWSSFPGVYQSFSTFLQAGTYTISVGGWAPGEGASLSYQLLIGMSGQQDNAPPLVDSPAPAIQVALASFSAPAPESVASSPAPTAGPVMGLPAGGGTSESVGGELGPGEAIGGGSVGGESGALQTVAAGAIGGGSPEAASTAPGVAISTAAAATGLAGLAMGPLGGPGGPIGLTASPTIQVALDAPSAASPTTISSIAVGLVTATQVLPWDRDGQTIRPEEPANHPAEATDRPASPGESPSAIEVVPTAGPPAGGPAASADPSPTAGPAPEAPVGPDAVVMAPVDPGAGPPADPAPSPSGGEASRPAIGGGAAGWLLAAATAAALYRARDAIRGLQWRKRARAGLGVGRSVLPIASAAWPGGAILADPAGSPYSAHVGVAPSRCGVPAPSPRS